MMQMLARLFARGEPTLSEATARDTAAFAALHGASFASRLIVLPFITMIKRPT